MRNKRIKILDCTLRDGGYYNNWDFYQDLVETYLKAMDQASIDVVEIGFRSPPSRSFMGPYLYSQDDYLEKLPLPKKAQIGVMINAKEYLKAADKPKELINKLFQSAECSPVGLIRVAINFEKALEAKVLTDEFKALGYQVGLNMMQSHGKKKEQYEQKAQRITEWGSVDVLYFADSLGNMDPVHISFICSAIQNFWSGPLGIHTHNNKGLALSSRNNYLSFQDQVNASLLYKSLMLVREAISRGEKKTKTLKVLFEDSIYACDDIKIDYISVACNDTLKELKTVKPNSLISAAIFFKKVRLIDNFVYQSST